MQELPEDFFNDDISRDWPHFMYPIGSSASGKTTAMLRLFEEMGGMPELFKDPVPHHKMILGDRMIVLLGDYTKSPHGGIDKVDQNKL